MNKLAFIFGLLFGLTLFGTVAEAASVSLKEVESNNLVCGAFVTEGVSCVSKASIERDQLEIELLNLKIQAFKEAQEKKVKKGK